MKDENFSAHKAHIFKPNTRLFDWNGVGAMLSSVSQSTFNQWPGVQQQRQ